MKVTATGRDRVRGAEWSCSEGRGGRAGGDKDLVERGEDYSGEEGNRRGFSISIAIAVTLATTVSPTVNVTSTSTVTNTIPNNNSVSRSCSRDQGLGNKEDDIKPHGRGCPPRCDRGPGCLEPLGFKAIESCSKREWSLPGS